MPDVRAEARATADGWKSAGEKAARQISRTVEAAKEFRERLKSQKKGNGANEKPQLKVGDFVAGYEIIRIRPGTNGKVAIIGRKMAIVEKVSAKLEANNNIELFNKDYQNKINAKFDIDGVSKDWNEVSKNFADKTKYKPRDENDHVTPENLPDTDMYKVNEQWADKLNEEGYEVIDMGNPEGAQKSDFFDMEQKKSFWRH